MRHTQPGQKNNNRPCALVRAIIHVYVYVSRFRFPDMDMRPSAMAMANGHCHVRVWGLCAIKAHKTHHARARVAIWLA